MSTAAVVPLTCMCLVLVTGVGVAAMLHYRKQKLLSKPIEAIENAMPIVSVSPDAHSFAPVQVNVEPEQDRLGHGDDMENIEII